jgi:hypothetical protein
MIRNMHDRTMTTTPSGRKNLTGGGGFGGRPDGNRHYRGTVKVWGGHQSGRPSSLYHKSHKLRGGAGKSLALDAKQFWNLLSTWPFRLLLRSSLDASLSFFNGRITCTINRFDHFLQ